MKWFSRFTVIGKTFYRYGLSDLVAGLVRAGWLRRLLLALPKSKRFAAEPMPVRLRLAGSAS